MPLTVGLTALLAALVSSPAAYAQVRIPVQVSAGLYHTCALMSDGSIQCWGSNVYGQATDHAGPFIQISAGNLQTCGLRSNGNVDCWGLREYSCVPEVGCSYSPAEGNVGPFAQVGAGTDNVCAVKTNGDVLCWGKGNTDGLWPGPYTQVGASEDHACALVPLAAGTSSRPAGSYCWGSGKGLGDHFGYFTQIAVGGSHNCALWLTGHADCWGSESIWAILPAIW